MFPCPSCCAANEAAAARCADCGAPLASVSKLESAMLRPRLRALPLFVTALGCAAAGLGAASLAFRSRPAELSSEALADEHAYPSAAERALPQVDETTSLAEGAHRSYPLAIGTHLIRMRSAPGGLVLRLGQRAHCTSPLPDGARAWFETRCTLRTRSFLTISNPPGAEGGGAAAQVSLTIATVLRD